MFKNRVRINLISTITAKVGFSIFPLLLSFVRMSKDGKTIHTLFPVPVRHWPCTRFRQLGYVIRCITVYPLRQANTPWTRRVTSWGDRFSLSAQLYYLFDRLPRAFWISPASTPAYWHRRGLFGKVRRKIRFRFLFSANDFTTTTEADWSTWHKDY